MNYKNQWFVCYLLAILISGCQTSVSQSSGQEQSQHESVLPMHANLDYNKRFLPDPLVNSRAAGRTFFVKPSGREAAKGTKDDPFPSILNARDAIRELKLTSGLPDGGINVRIAPGAYSSKRTIVLTAEDSGTGDAPISYIGAIEQESILTGGLELSTKRLSKVDSKNLVRLHKNARGRVWQMPINEQQRRFFSANGRGTMLVMDGHLLPLARWPNRGYCHIGEILDEGPSTRHLGPNEKPKKYSRQNPTGGKFKVREALSDLVVDEFSKTGAMRVQGYLHNDWYFQDEEVGSIENKVVQLLKHTRYGIKDDIKSIPRRVRIVNVLAELDEPGEWYFDSTAGELFVWPIPGFSLEQSVLRVLDKSQKPLVELRDTKHLTLRHLVFENFGKLGVGVYGGRHNLIGGCTFRNAIGRGVTIENGFKNGVSGCDFFGLESAFSIRGGDFQNLVRCYHFATNNDVHDCRRRGYGVVGLQGVGIYFAHNVLHDMNGALSFRCVDTLIEFNEFYNIGYEMGDFNVAYCGALWYTMNNVLRFNFVHHLLEPGGHPVCGFRNDDGGAGLQIFGNVFYRPGRGAAQFHGPLNSFENNIVLECYTMWWTNQSPISREQIAKAWKRLERFGKELPQGDKGDNLFITEKILGKAGWKKEPWASEFPELTKTIESNPFSQSYCRVRNNLCWKVSRPFHIHGGDGTVKGMESKQKGEFRDLPASGIFELPKAVSLDAFVNVESLDFRFRDDYSTIDHFQKIPFERIGFIKDDLRQNPPSKESYRSQTYKKFLSDRGGKYHFERVNARYPTPKYLED